MNRRRTIRKVNRSMQHRFGGPPLVWGLRSLFAALAAIGAGWLVYDWLGLGLSLLVGFFVWLVAIGWWLRE